jgi:hypothetical protein
MEKDHQNTLANYRNPYYNKYIFLVLISLRKQEPILLGDGGFLVGSVNLKFR